MQIEEFVQALGADFFTGVPDSLLKPLGNYLMDTYGIDGRHHVIAANEGNCTALAAGYHLATGRVPVVYMQNSGQGNAINPIASLLSDKVYGIPVIFVIGWRGEPGVHDEPQHVYQGQVTVKLMEDMDIATYVIGKDTTGADIKSAMADFHKLLSAGKSIAFVVKKGALSYSGKRKYANGYAMKREDIIQHILRVTGDDPVGSTTGKARRELFELREALGQNHSREDVDIVLQRANLGNKLQNQRENKNQESCIGKVLGDKHFAKTGEDFGAQGTSYIGHQAEYAQGSKAHNQLNNLGDGCIAIFKKFIQAILGRAATGQHGNGNAQEQGKDNNL